MPPHFLARLLLAACLLCLTGCKETALEGHSAPMIGPTCGGFDYLTLDGHSYQVSPSPLYPYLEARDKKPSMAKRWSTIRETLGFEPSYKSWRQKWGHYEAHWGVENNKLLLTSIHHDSGTMQLPELQLPQVATWYTGTLAVPGDEDANPLWMYWGDYDYDSYHVLYVVNGNIQEHRKPSKYEFSLQQLETEQAASCE